MINYSEALKLVLETQYRTQSHNVSLLNCHNNILYEDVYSDIDMPPFDKSMVDGYACFRSDISKHLTISSIMAAGSNLLSPLQHDTCVKIMTGAAVPPNTELVVMIEDVEIIADNKIKINNQKSASNIALKAEDFKKGTIIIEKNTLLRPFHAGILASLGKNEIKVYKTPKVAIIVTGNEVIEPTQTIEGTQIFNANAYLLINNLLALNINPFYYGIVNDDYQEIKKAIDICLSDYDIVIITGGVSVGDYDFVAPILKKSDLNLKFDSIAIQPGRPLVFAASNNKFCFGLPGNPVSGLVIFEIIIKHFLYHIMGHEYKPKFSQHILLEDIERKKAERRSYYPVKLNEDNTISVIKYNGSAHISAYNEAYGIIFIEKDNYKLEKGNSINVRQI